MGTTLHDVGDLSDLADRLESERQAKVAKKVAIDAGKIHSIINNYDEAMMGMLSEILFDSSA